MAFREQLTITMAPSGAGKTFVRCAKFLTEFLKEEKGVSYSNFPIHLDEFQRFFEGEIDPEEVERRLQIIPDDVLLSWSSGESGPWEYFRGVDYRGSHIQLDEAHLYIPDGTKAYRQWRDWLVAVRHGKGTVEFITQAPENIHQKIVKLAGTHIHLMDTQSTTDPFFKIQTSDWFELKAKLTGKYVSYFLEKTKKKMFGVYLTQSVKYHQRDPKFFALYNSYNTVGNVEGSEGAPEHEFQKRSLFGLLCWFYSRNRWTLSLRGGGAVLFLALIISFPSMLNHALTSIAKNGKARLQKVEAKQNGGSPAPAAVQAGEREVKLTPVKGPYGKSIWGPEDLDRLKQENEELKRTVASQATEFIRLRTAHQQMEQNILKAKQANDLIGMLFKDKAVTVGGRVVIAGDKLSLIDGEKVIKAFDYESSKIVFTDDSSHWVTIGQRRVQDSTEISGIQTNAEAATGIDSGGPAGARETGGQRLAPNNLQGSGAAVKQRDFNHRSPVRHHDNSDARTTIYSDYVGPK